MVTDCFVKKCCGHCRFWCTRFVMPLALYKVVGLRSLSGLSYRLDVMRYKSSQIALQPSMQWIIHIEVLFIALEGVLQMG